MRATKQKFSGLNKSHLFDLMLSKSPKGVLVVQSQPSSPQHPGKFLQEHYLKPRKISTYDFAKMIHVPESVITKFVAGETPVTVGLSVRLARVFELSSGDWIALQKTFDDFSH